MSMWLSGANTVLNSAATYAYGRSRRAQSLMLDSAAKAQQELLQSITQAWVEAWTQPLHTDVWGVLPTQGATAGRAGSPKRSSKAPTRLKRGR